VVAARELIRLVQLSSSPLHLIGHNLPEVALNLRDRLHELLRLLSRLQIVVVVGSLTHVGPELRSVVVILDALLAGLADGARALGLCVLVRVAQMHVVPGVEADLADGGRDARSVADEAAIDGGVGEVGDLALVAALLVEVVGDLVPRQVLLLTQGLDDDVLGVFFGVAAGAGLLVLRLEDGDVVRHLGLDGARALETVHVVRVRVDGVDGSIEVRLAVED
jgi:hypothetical protein